MAAELTKSGKFIVLERTDLNKLEAESELLGLSPEEFKENLVGVDALILRSVVEYGRKDTGDVALFSRSRKQVAHSKVNVRLVDPRAGHVFFSEDGAGGGNPLAALIVSAVDAAITAGAVDYRPLAIQANTMAVNPKGVGLPAGPYHPEFQKDRENYQ